MNRLDTIDSKLTWSGLALMALTGLIHVVEAPEYLEEKRYIGILFIVAGIGAVISMYGIWKAQSWGWQLGVVVAGGSAAAYLASRTVGLPGFRENSWSQFLEPSGMISLVVELLFCYVAFRVLTDQGKPVAEESWSSR